MQSRSPVNAAMAKESRNANKERNPIKRPDRQKKRQPKEGPPNPDSNTKCHTYVRFALDRDKDTENVTKEKLTSKPGLSPLNGASCRATSDEIQIASSSCRQKFNSVCCGVGGVAAVL